MMGLRRVHPTGRDYLDLGTRLLRDARLREPDGGMWDASDLQWWWRADQHPDSSGAAFWLDGDRPVVAAVATGWRDYDEWNLFGTDADVGTHADELWAYVHATLGTRRAVTSCRVDDADRISRIEAAAFRRTDEEYVTARMDAGAAPSRPDPPAGYEVIEYDGGPHWMTTRSGANVADRLAECSIYTPSCDLAIRAEDGSIAGYALFWPDLVTGVGELEPMRVEDAHQGRGLGGVLLREGLARLVAAGCQSLTVTYQPTNQPARRLYLGAGFEPVLTAREYERIPPG